MARRGKKNYKVRTSARTASKGLEKELKKKAKRLAKDPTLILPKCTRDVPYFKKLEKKLRDVQGYKDDKSKLTKYSKKGDRLVRAYAGTLILLHEDKISYLAVLRSPFGDVGYALRGQTDKEKLVGVQNYDDPRLKMMAFLKEVKKKKLFLFITDDELICTGKDPTPPKEVIEQLPDRIKGEMRRSINILHSPDIDPSNVQKGKPAKEPYLVINWEPADIYIAKSLTSSRQNEDNTFATCAQYMASAKMTQYFSVETFVRPYCEAGKDCPCNPPPKKEEKLSFLERLGKVKPPSNEEIYLEGRLMDHRLIEKDRDEYHERLEEVGDTVYIVGNICYGKDKTKLIDSLDTTPDEREVFRIFLDIHEGPIISPETSVNRIMAPYWEEMGKSLLERILKDKETASGIYNKYPVPRYQPMTVVEEGRYLLAEKRIRDKLPEPKNPPPMIEFAYECAIAYLARGKEGASKVLKDFPGDDIKLKAAKYAFVEHLDLSKTSGWSYTTHEVGYAQGMDKIVGKIVSEDPESFKNGLKELWKATGSTVDLEFS